MPLKSLTEFNEERRRFYEPEEYKNGIACPVCGKELIDSNPGLILTSSPPQAHIECLGCKWTGTKIA